MTISTRQNRYKEGVRVNLQRLKHVRTRKKYYLIIDPHKIHDIRGKTGVVNLNVRPICSGCKKSTVLLKADYGITSEPRREEIARYCRHCEVIFPKYRKVIPKRIIPRKVISTYE